MPLKGSIGYILCTLGVCSHGLGEEESDLIFLNPGDRKQKGEEIWSSDHFTGTDTTHYI